MLEGFVETNVFSPYRSFCCDLITQPYGQARNNIRKSFTPYQIIQGRVVYVSVGRLLAHVIIAHILIIPIINSIALYILYSAQARFERAVLARREAAFIKFKGTAVAFLIAKRMIKIARANIADRRAAEAEHKSRPSLLGRVHHRMRSGFGTLVGLVWKNRRIAGRGPAEKIESAAASIGAAGLTIQALRERKWRIAGYGFLMTIGNLFNATVSLILPRNVRASMRANY